MSRRQSYDEWRRDFEYEQMCQEAEVADREETDRRNDWIFWTPVKVGLVEMPVVLLVVLLLALAGGGESWLMGIVVAPMVCLFGWSQQVGFYLHNYGKEGVKRKFWQWHLWCLFVIPLFGFGLWLLVLFIFVVVKFLKLMLGGN